MFCKIKWGAQFFGGSSILRGLLRRRWDGLCRRWDRLRCRWAVFVVGGQALAGDFRARASIMRLRERGLRRQQGLPSSTSGGSSPWSVASPAGFVRNGEGEAEKAGEICEKWGRRSLESGAEQLIRW
ncbi:hypothetical protein Dimus_006038, partial [Dionaea muscipula]